MKHKKIIIILFLLSIIIVTIVLVPKDKEIHNSDMNPVAEATDINGVLCNKDKYTNLIFHEFESPISKVNELYDLEIRYDRSCWDRSGTENLEILNEIIDKFFGETIDKSYLLATLDYESEKNVSVSYTEIYDFIKDDKHKKPKYIGLFGNDTSNGGYMIQISNYLNNVWFSKNGFGTIHPSMCENIKVYPYISGKRQVEDMDINLKDGNIKLSEMEEKVLTYLNNTFPISVPDGVKFCISEVRVIDIGDYEGVCFKVRRQYKGVLFEYGSSFSSGIYVDDYNADYGEISYIESTSPDTILAFGTVNGPIIETKTITEMITLEEALDKLSESIGDNSIYDVYGVELVYRETIKYNESIPDVSARLVPKWKVITINQNDDKYTMFYIDVVTGEITERFEYHYE